LIEIRFRLKQFKREIQIQMEEEEKSYLEWN